MFGYLRGLRDGTLDPFGGAIGYATGSGGATTGTPATKHTASGGSSGGGQASTGSGSDTSGIPPCPPKSCGDPKPCCIPQACVPPPCYDPEADGGPAPQGNSAQGSMSGVGYYSQLQGLRGCGCGGNCSRCRQQSACNCEVG